MDEKELEKELGEGVDLNLQHDPQDEETGDLERGGEEQEAEAESPTEPADPNLVTWDGPDDPANPKGWSFKRKWLATGLVSLISFMTPMSSSMIAPALPQIGIDLNVSSSFLLQLIFSIFLLAFSIAPLFLAPLSEVYGRVIVLQLSNVFFLIFTLACGFAQNAGQMLAFRFLSGIGASAPLTSGSGLLGDLWTAEQRGMAMALYALAPLLGPALGPLMGAWITENTTWRWSFWSVVMFGVMVQVLIYFTLPETYGPKILEWKAKKLRRESGNQLFKTQYEQEDRRFLNIMGHALVRPFKLLLTQPIIQFVTCYMSLNYGIIYITLSTFPRVWAEIYHESLGIAGLNYISILLGLLVGAQTSGRFCDWLYRYLKAKAPDHRGRPEFRVPPLFIATSLISTGLFVYGWGAQSRTHWIVPNIGAFLFSAGSAYTYTAIQTYVVDAYTVFAASALSALVVIRSLAGFGFPLFAPALFDALGWGWGNSLLAFVTLGIGYPGALVLWFYGERLRLISPYATDK